MFTKRFVVSRHCIFLHECVLCASRAATESVGLWLGWCNVGSWLAQCWVMVSAMLGDGWHNVGDG